MTINAINDYTTLSTMFTLVNKSQVSKNQKPRAKEPEAKCADFEVFFKPISCYPPLFFAASFRFQADKAVLHGYRL
jgi:hypothetical protein